jgi:uncharacterized protein YdeI (YjbR/CyaY-like superfamily)
MAKARAVQATKSAAAFERIAIRSRGELRSWLERNHRRAASVWCVTWKKRAGAPHVPYTDIVEEALCFGWIDSLPRALDAAHSMLLLSPRKAQSNWSRLNKLRVERLTAAGLMTPEGLKAVDLAKANGKWTFLDDVDALTLPPDLRAAFEAEPGSQLNWDRFPPSAKRGILEWIKNAKGAQTRARRVAETAALAGKNIRANHFRQKLPIGLAETAAKKTAKPQ